MKPVDATVDIGHRSSTISSQGPLALSKTVFLPMTGAAAPTFGDNHISL